MRNVYFTCKCLLFTFLFHLFSAIYYVMDFLCGSQITYLLAVLMSTIFESAPFAPYAFRSSPTDLFLIALYVTLRVQYIYLILMIPKAVIFWQKQLYLLFLSPN